MSHGCNSENWFKSNSQRQDGQWSILFDRKGIRVRDNVGYPENGMEQLDQAKTPERSLWIELRKVRMACPPAVVQVMPERFKRWVNPGVLQLAFSPHWPLAKYEKTESAKIATGIVTCCSRWLLKRVRVRPRRTALRLVITKCWILLLQLFDSIYNHLMPSYRRAKLTGNVWSHSTVYPF